MSICAAKFCYKSSGKQDKSSGVTFHRFPSDPIIADLWIKNIRLSRKEECWKPTKNIRVCSIHFDDKYKYTTKSGLRKLHRDAVPTKVMGTDMCRKYLQNICKHLTVFETKPKTIEGNIIREWFNVGEDIFQELYNLGTSVKWNPSEIKKQAETVDVVTQVSRNQGWLQTFITIYPGLRVDLEGATPAVDICRVRSGIEFLLHGFTGINQNFDKVLNDLKELGELEEFDEQLKIWKEGYRPEFFPKDRHTDTPKSHWWWF